MKIFNINDEDDLIEYNEEDFSADNLEQWLEEIIEKNPKGILEDENVFIIGRQVRTNLGSVIDLLGIDKNGSLVVVELKRDKTPRETVAQILEYASYLEDLSYYNLEDIFIDYTGDEDINLTDYHRDYFKLNESEGVAYNKNQKLVIIAQEITKEVKQTAVYLRKMGLDFYCVEFKYFIDHSDRKIISIENIIGNDIEPIRNRNRKPRIDREEFISSLDNNGMHVFTKLFDFAEQNNYQINWGTVGFSLNVLLDNNEQVPFLRGFSDKSQKHGQSFRTCTFVWKRKEVNNYKEIESYYFNELKQLGFKDTGKEMIFVIDEKGDSEQIDALFNLLKDVAEKIQANGIYRNKG